MGRYLDLADQAVVRRKAPGRVPAQSRAPSPAHSAASWLPDDAAATSYASRHSPQGQYEEDEINEISPTALPRSEQGARGPEEWVVGVEKLKLMRVPQSTAPRYWRQAVTDANRFLSRWGTAAAVLGWSTLDLFGAHRHRPLARYDTSGLVVVLDGAEVVALTADCAEIRTRSGALQRYRRRPCNEPGRVALWELPDR